MLCGWIGHHGSLRSSLLVSLLLVNHHPVDPELVTELAEAVREERFSDCHEYFAALAERFVNPLGFLVGIDAYAHVGTAHWLSALRWTVAGHHHGVAQHESRVDDVVRFEPRRQILRSTMCAHFRKGSFHQNL